MPIDHSSCAHPRTPAGRAACRRQRDAIVEKHGAGKRHTQRANLEAAMEFDKQRRQRPVEASRERRPSDASYWRRGDRTGTLKALNEAPARVRVFIERCEDLGFKINPMPVETGHSIEVYSSRGAGRVTWNGEAVQWFTRLGYTSITSRVKNLREVWAVLGVPLEEDD